jgi:hypothetical protein
MLKMIGHIHLILLLLFATGGVNIYRHYCGTSLMKQTVQILPESCCDGHCKACHNETMHLKVTDNFESASLKVDFKTFLSQLFDYSQFQQVIYKIDLISLAETNQIRAVTYYPPDHLLADDSEANLQVFRL